jgi:hypothetical protein
MNTFLYGCQEIAFSRSSSVGTRNHIVRKPIEQIISAIILDTSALVAHLRILTITIEVVFRMTCWGFIDGCGRTRDGEDRKNDERE